MILGNTLHFVEVKAHKNNLYTRKSNMGLSLPDLCVGEYECRR